MDATLHALGGILLRALPTFFLVVLLHFYLKYVFFRPLERVLRDRYEATGGARKLAEASLAKAGEKAAHYEAALREVRAEVYQEQERLRRQMLQEQAEAIHAARARAGVMVAEAKAQIEAEAAEARRSLEAQAEVLATEIAERLLARRVA
jgi:F-type H+-transporting ATPase subunit b